MVTRIVRYYNFKIINTINEKIGVIHLCIPENPRVGLNILIL